MECFFAVFLCFEQINHQHQRQKNYPLDEIDDFVFRSQNGQKCVDSRGFAPDPAGELTALPTPRSWTKGKGQKGGRWRGRVVKGYERVKWRVGKKEGKGGKEREGAEVASGRLQG